MKTHDAHVTSYKLHRVQQEAKRVSRTLKGLESTEARARAHRLSFAEIGISCTNLVFDKDLAESNLSPEIVEILKDDPEKDTGIMHTRVPTNAQTSTIAESDRGGMKSLVTDLDDDTQTEFYTAFDLNELGHIQSASMRVIDRLPLFIHNLKRWSNGFDLVKFKRAEGIRKKEFINAAIPAKNLTKRGKITTRRAPVPRRKPRTRTNALMS